MRPVLLILPGTREDSTRPEQFERAVVDSLGSELRAAPVFLVEQQTPGDAMAVLRAVRGHRLPSIYLKPVVLLADRVAASSLFVRAFDGVWDSSLHPEMPPGLATQMERLRQRAEGFGMAGPEGDSELSLRILRFMATRGGTFEPETTIGAASGYRYPPLNPFLGIDDARDDVGEILSGLESQRVLKGVFQTKAYTCTHCGCAFLNFLEVCPDCGTSDLTVDSMVHHFRCGYVAPLRDFDRGESVMVCPKCDREVHHVGVDYDKPSLVYDCNECQNRFSEPVITTSCYRCRRVTPPDIQVQRTIKSYSVSPFGENAATHGLDSLFVRVLQQKLVLFDYAVFKQLLAAETHRITRYERSESVLLVLSFQGIEHVYSELGDRARELFEGVTAAFKDVLRESDLLSSRNESLFLALLAETSAEQAKRAGERIMDAVNQLLGVGLKRPPRLSVVIRPVAEGLDADSVVEEIMAQQETEPPSGDLP